MIYRIAGLFALISIFIACESQNTKPMFVASNLPVKMIIEEIAGASADVFCPVKPGGSPHTFNPAPSDMYKIESARAFFYVSENLDGWAVQVKKDVKIELIKMLPDEFLLSYDDVHSHEGHEHNETEEFNDKYHNVDPHFWTDPLAVKSMVLAIVDTMSKIDPDNAASYQANGEIFRNKLDELHKQAENKLLPVAGSPVFLFHPSFRYMLKRYGLVYSGAIEPAPGKEPSPKFIQQITEKLKLAGAKAIFTEPQLPAAPAKALAEAVNISLYELDPLGGVTGRMNYSDLILYNADILLKALK